MMLLGGGLVIAIAVALQHFVIFRFTAAVVITGAGLALTASFLTRASLDSLATSMRYNLSQMSTESKPLYKEIAV